jgi:hypothetical protein
MPKQWKCARCSTKNLEPSLTCSTCRMIRGAVVVPRGIDSLRLVPYDVGRSSAQRAAPPAPAASEWARHASNRRPLVWPILAVALVVVLGVAAGTATYWSDDYGAGAVATAQITPARTIAASDLAVGDCFDLTQPSADEFTDVFPRSCSAAHEFEVFWIGAMRAGPYPGGGAFRLFYDDNCLDAFQAYVGEAWADSALAIYWVVPTEEGWDLGDKTVQCSVYHPDIPRLTYSLRGWSHPKGDSLPL